MIFGTPQNRTSFHNLYHFQHYHDTLFFLVKYLFCSEYIFLDLQLHSNSISTSESKILQLWKTMLHVQL